MKKFLFLLLAGIMITATACQAGGNQPAPTAISLPTAADTPTPVTLNPTVEGKPGEAGQERTSPVDGMIQVYIPEGTFRMGGLDTGMSPNEDPAHDVTMKGYWMDKLEVTNAMYSLCVNAGACQPPQKFNSKTRPDYYTNPAYADYPVVLVRWRDANAYCNWAGRRLPTEAEWERAARGGDYRIYPWGEARPDNSLANFNYMVGDTAKVGSYPAGASPFGILDMAGNVYEWTNDWFDAQYYLSSPVINPTGPGQAPSSFYRVIRGGSWVNEEAALRVSGRSFAPGGNDAAKINSDAYNGEANDHLGFRCVSDQ